MRERLAVLAAALWWGSLTAIGFVAVPTLFAQLPSAAVAGSTAARLFASQTWLSVACGLALLLMFKPSGLAGRMQIARPAMVFIVLGLLCALLGEFAVAPRIVARDNLKLWHAVGSGLYLLQWLCAGTVLWRLAGRAQP